MKAFIYPYKPGSESAKALAEGLDIKRISHKNSRFKGSKDKLVVNWGASKVSEEVSKCTILNLPQAVELASNKLLAFKKWHEGRRLTRKVWVGGNELDLSAGHNLFDEVPEDFVGKMKHNRYGPIEVFEPHPDQDFSVRTPEFTEDRLRAKEWLFTGHTVVERHILNGNSGAGIKLIEPENLDQLGRAPLYVKYVPKKQEYRVHVCGGQAVDIQRKARRKDVEDEDINWKIRNHDNGFIFARNEDGFVPPDVVTQAVNAVTSLGLAFGAVDVIFNDKSQKAYVLEVNTAPGMTGATLEGYVARFKDYLDGKVALPEQNVPEAFVGAPVGDLEQNAPGPAPFVLPVWANAGPNMIEQILGKNAKIIAADDFF